MCKKEIAKMIEILNQHNIELSIWGCGCCSSPMVSFKYKGEVVVDGAECFCFDNSRIEDTNKERIE